MRLLSRPIDEWPAPFTTNRKTPQFSATWTETLQLLEPELSHLAAQEAVIQAAADEQPMRLDAGLRADAKVCHPGVILSFETNKHGPMRHFSDVFDRGARQVKAKSNCDGTWTVGRTESFPSWQMNARAIALGLEAPRKVDRYGIAKRRAVHRRSALPLLRR